MPIKTFGSADSAKYFWPAMRTPLASAALGSLKRPRIAFCSSGDICVEMGVQVASRSQTRSGGWWYSRRSQKILPKHLPGHRGWQPGEPCRYRQGWCRRMLQYANVRWHEHHRIALRACPGTTYLATTLLERSLNKRKTKMEKRRQGEREDGGGCGTSIRAAADSAVLSMAISE